MGYTHFYCVRKAYDMDAFAKVANDFQKIVNVEKETTDKILTSRYGSNRLIINNQRIEFTGIGEPEQFILERIMSDLEYTAHKILYEIRGKKITEDSLLFCFTHSTQKQYNLYVQTVLIIAKHHFGENILVSGGTMKDWHDAINLCHDILGYGTDFKPDE